MTDVLQTDREADEYAWLVNQADAIRRRSGIDYDALAAFIEESADDMVRGVKSNITHLLAHAAKAAHTKNPDVIGHWRTECTRFHTEILNDYCPSMHQKIEPEMALLWKRAKRLVYASFEDHGEPRPRLPDYCPVSLEALLDPDLHLDFMIGWMHDKEIEDPSESDFGLK